MWPGLYLLCTSWKLRQWSFKQQPFEVCQWALKMPGKSMDQSIEKSVTLSQILPDWLQSEHHKQYLISKSPMETAMPPLETWRWGSRKQSKFNEEKKSNSNSEAVYCNQDLTRYHSFCIFIQQSYKIKLQIRNKGYYRMLTLTDSQISMGVTWIFGQIIKYHTWITRWHWYFPFPFITLSLCTL